MSIYFPFISTIYFHSVSISSTVFVDGFVIPPFPPSLQLPCLREPLHALHQLRHVAVRGEGQVHRLKWPKLGDLTQKYTKVGDLTETVGDFTQKLLI